MVPTCPRAFPQHGAISNPGLGELGRVVPIYSPTPHQKVDALDAPTTASRKFCFPQLCLPPQPPSSLQVALALTGCDITVLDKPLPTGERSSPGECLCVPQWPTSTPGQRNSGTVGWEAMGRGTEVKKEDKPYSHFHSLFCAGTEAPTLPRVLQLPHLNQSTGYSHTRNEDCALRACSVQECCSPFDSQIQHICTVH